MLKEFFYEEHSFNFAIKVMLCYLFVIATVYYNPSKFLSSKVLTRQMKLDAFSAEINHAKTTLGKVQIEKKKKINYCNNPSKLWLIVTIHYKHKSRKKVQQLLISHWYIYTTYLIRVPISRKIYVKMHSELVSSMISSLWCTQM